MTTLPAIRAGRASPLAGLAGAAVAGALLGVVLAGHPPSDLAVAAGVVGAGLMLVLALSNYEAAVAAGFVLFGVVRFEPAPSDALLALLAALAIASGRLDLRRVPAPILALLAGLLALNVLSIAGAADLGGALRYFAITLYLAVLAVWLASYLRSASRMRLVIGAYLAGAVASSALAVVSLFVAYPGHELLTGESAARAQGLFKDPNVFGPFLVPAALIALEETLRPRLLGLRRPVSAAALAVLALGIVFAYSRAGWLNFAVAVGVMLLVVSLRADAARAAGAALVLVVLIAGVAGAAVVFTGSGAFLEERARAQAYDTVRFSAQRTGVQLASEHALGVGPGQFEQDQPVSAHSIYVRVLAEQGVLGLAILVALLAGTLALAVRNAVAGRDAHGVGSAVLLGAWCGLLANSAFVDTLHWRHLWLVAALIWVAAVPARR
ncbi:MAG TPA: O-antigen ligase family protein [Solirubrobacteraceae bacterium]|nr:O-antigen ligase family protein [Solirubrobacteraceae bacterium]